MTMKRENYWIPFAKFLVNSDIKAKDAAEVIGCPEASIVRILAAQTLPSDEMVEQIELMMKLGFPQYAEYSKLSKADRHKFSENTSKFLSGASGFWAIGQAISAAGVAGLSGAGVTSGLAAIGTIVGGGMVAGVGVTAAIPLATGYLGWKGVQKVQKFNDARNLHKVTFDQRWEILSEN